MQMSVLVPAHAVKPHGVLKLRAVLCETVLWVMHGPSALPCYRYGGDGVAQARPYHETF